MYQGKERKEGRRQLSLTKKYKELKSIGIALKLVASCCVVVSGQLEQEQAHRQVYSPKSVDHQTPFPLLSSFVPIQIMSTIFATTERTREQIPFRKLQLQLCLADFTLFLIAFTCLYSASSAGH